MSNLAGFDSTKFEDDSNSFEPLPAGNYKVIVTASDVKDTRAGTGKYISLQLQVVEGPSSGRTLFHNINFANPNPIAQEIGQKELSALSRSVGLTSPQDTSELHDKPVIAKVIAKLDDYRGDGSYKNEIKRFSPVPAAGSAPAAPAAPAAPTMSWDK